MEWRVENGDVFSNISSNCPLSARPSFFEVICNSKDSSWQTKMQDQTSERAIHSPSKIYTYLWKSSPDHLSVFFLMTSISGLLKLTTYRGWSFLTASQSSQVSLHTLIYRHREAKCSQLPAFQTQAGFITSLHPHHFNQLNFGTWYERASTTALGRPFSSQ